MLCISEMETESPPMPCRGLRANTKAATLVLYEMVQQHLQSH